MRGGRGLFVTGTDTGVGKTVITAGLLRILRRYGVSAGAMKPVETGCRRVSGRLTGSDSRLLSAASEPDGNGNRVGLYRFRDPVAPLLAARAEGVRIDLGRIVRAYRNVSARHSITFVEGIGGFR
jgi:dethiobiotin synthetase